MKDFKEKKLKFSNFKIKTWKRFFFLIKPM